MSSKPTEGASVIACLRDLWPDFQLTYDNQMNPTSDIAIKFYARFICGQLQIEIGDIQQTLTEHSSHPGAFADILNIYALYMCTATVIKKLGLIELIQTFGLTDLLSPMRKKFKMSLILLSNCVIYVTGLQEFMEEIKNKVFEALQGTKDIQYKIENIKEKINNAVLLHIKNMQKKDDLRKHKDTLLKELQITQEIYEPIRENTKTQRNQLSQIQDEYETLESKLKDLQSQEEKLKSQIIDDIPSITREKDRLIKEKQELLSESDDYKNIMNKKMQTITCYQENLNYIQQFLEITPLNKLLDNYEILNKYNNEIELNQNEIKSYQEIEEHDPNILKLIQDENKILEDKIQEQKNKHENQMKKYDREIRELEDELKEEETKKSEAKELSEKLDKNIEEMVEYARHLEENIDSQNSYYDQNYKIILELKGQLDNKVMSIIDMVENKTK